MQLGKKKDTKDFMDAMKSEEGIDGLDDPSPLQSTGRGPSSQAPPAPSVGYSSSFFFSFFFFFFSSFPLPNLKILSSSVQILIEEKIVVVANRDGGLQNMEVKGDLTLRITDAAKSAVKIALKSPSEDKSLQFKVRSFIRSVRDV